jgi:hypothetical protein
MRELQEFSEKGLSLKTKRKTAHRPPYLAGNMDTKQPNANWGSMLPKETLDFHFLFGQPTNDDTDVELPLITTPDLDDIQSERAMYTMSL